MSTPHFTCADVPTMFRLPCSESGLNVRWSPEGLMQPTNVLEAATLRMSIVPVCQCGHSARFEPHCLWWHFERRGWDDRLSVARERFWCCVCRSRLRQKVRPMRLDLVPLKEGDFELPWPDETVWKRATARLR